MCRSLCSLGRIFFLCLFFSCALADLRRVEFSTYPDKPNTVLEGAYSPVIIRFGAEMEKDEAERLLSVTGPGSSVEGDLRWEGNDLYFRPRGGWSFGVPYTLHMSGSACAKDGRELRPMLNIPFYAGSSGEGPVITSFVPPDGASTGVSPDEGAAVILFFSSPMDRKTTELAFSWDCPGEKEMRWDDDDRRLEVRPGTKLPPWTSFRWSLDVSALSRELIPLMKQKEGRFSTDLDRKLPRVERCFPLLPQGAGWLEGGLSLAEGLGPAHAIGVMFNKDMDKESVMRSLRFEPSLSGRTEMLSPAAVVFIPEQTLGPGEAFTLIVSGDARDTSGLKLGSDYIEYFTSDIPYLELTSLSIENLPPLTGDDLKNGSLHRVALCFPGLLQLTLGFSLPFTSGARLDTLSRVSLEPYFPSLPFPCLRQASPVLNDRLSLEWEGVRSGDSSLGVRHFYRLMIPGGKGGISPDGVSYLRENSFLYLEILP